MVTTTAFIYAQNPNTYISGTATIDSGETATLAVPCGGRAVVWIGVPTLDSTDITFTVVPYPGATARVLKDEAGNTVTVTAGTGGFAVAVPELAGCYSFTIVTTATQNSARAFAINVVGDNPSHGASIPALNITDQWTTTPYAFADVSAGADAWTTGHSPLTLFTVTGTVMARVVGAVGDTQLTTTSNDGTAAVGVAGATGALIAATTANGTTNFVADAVWVDTTPAVLAEAMPLNGGWFLVNSDIILTIATHDFTAGNITLYCQWIPVSSDGAVVAA